MQRLPGLQCRSGTVAGAKEPRMWANPTPGMGRVSAPAAAADGGTTALYCKAGHLEFSIPRRMVCRSG